MDAEGCSHSRHTRRYVTGWRGQAFWPPDGSRIEDPVAVSAGVHDSMMSLVFGPLSVSWCEWSRGYNLKALDIGRGDPVVLPANQAADPISFVGAEPFIDPVFRLSDGPVPIAVGTRFHSHQLLLFSVKITFAGKRPKRRARHRALVGEDFVPHCVP